nr:uncharacterized protein CI109_004816 [Kwoniella shandongensis]KAA5526816.1 hypothetical protein CI109_004816 [Kwoniella shandongensis]
MEPASAGRQVSRYHTRPSDDEVINDKTALVLYTDAFGLSLPNAKIMADSFADQLKVHVFVPEYIPDALPANLFEPVAPLYPGQYANRSWWSTFVVVLPLLLRVWRWLPWILNPKGQVPLAEKALLDLQSEGYTHLGAIGYCRGGAVIQYLLASTSHPTLLQCGVVNHPSPETSTWDNIHKPTQWHLAEHDQMFGLEKIANLRRVFEEKKKNEGVVFDFYHHKDTVHGFACRPTLDHEETKKAFEEAGDTAVAFLQKHLDL